VAKDKEYCKRCDGSGYLCDGCGQPENMCECRYAEVEDEVGFDTSECPDCNGTGESL
jgi:hypothetical protein